MSKVSDIPQAEVSVVAAEMARRQALEAMGIAVYVSRYDMPGAAPAVRQRLVQIEAAEVATADSPARAAVVNTANSTPVPQASSATNTELTSTPSQSRGVSQTKSAETVKFSMLLASAGPFLWVEQLADGLLRQDQLALINAMARALSSQVSVRQQQFDWPMRGNAALSGDAESATQALQGLIQRMAREVDAKRVVVMGACPFLPDRIAQSAVVIPATIAMLQNPALKREAWQALKPLRAIDLASN
jgi:hypothetical protein